MAEVLAYLAGGLWTWAQLLVTAFGVGIGVLLFLSWVEYLEDGRRRR